MIKFNLISATEKAAIAASKYVGSGDKEKIDSVATNAMREALNKLDFSGKVVLCEGIKDNAPCFKKGEVVGSSKKLSSAYEIACDPVDGTTMTSRGGPEAMSVLAIGESLFSTDVFYMNKIAVGPKIAKQISLSITDSVKRIVQGVALATGKDIITACLLDRPRNEKTISVLRECGCRVKLINDCDVSGAIAAVLPDTGIDLFLGIGGAPEGVISAAAIKAIGGFFEGVLVDNKEFKPIDDKILGFQELVKGDVMFMATGITNGSLLKGVRYTNHGVITHSILMDSSDGTVRWVKSNHGDLGQDE